MRYFLIVSLLVCNVCWADLYVVLDGTDVKGTLEADSRTKRSWSDMTLVPVGEEYRGKQHYEIKYEAGKVRLATQSEIDVYLAAQKVAQDAQKKQDALKVLGLTDKHLTKIKALP